MPGPLVTPDDLTRLLERFAIERGAARTAGEAADAQLQLLVARVAELTTALRNAGNSETTKVGERLLLADLAQIAAQFRARATEVGASLSTAREQVAEALRVVGPPAGPPT